MNDAGWTEAAAQLGRLSLLGVTVVFALQGLASADQAPGAADILVTVLAASAFHVAVYLWNDVVDLSIDRTVPRRATSPLVRGTVTSAQATGMVAVTVAVALGMALTQGLAAATAMIGAIVLLGAYNVHGKRASFPPLTDAVQGLGWAALAWCGALVGGGATTATWWLGVYLAASIVLVNGVHGSIRDLANDERHGARTTALLLGARVEASGHHTFPRALWAYALALHAAIVGVLVAALADLGTATPWRVGAVLVMGVACLVLLVGALQHADDGDRSWPASFAYLLAMMLAPTLLVLDHVRGTLAVAIIVLFVVPWAASRWMRSTLRRLVPPRRHASV